MRTTSREWRADRRVWARVVSACARCTAGGLPQPLLIIVVASVALATAARAQHDDVLTPAAPADSPSRTAEAQSVAFRAFPPIGLSLVQPPSPINDLRGAGTASNGTRPCAAVASGKAPALDLSLPSLELPSLSLTPLCGIPKSDRQNDPLATSGSARIDGAPCPREAFDVQPDNCHVRGGDSFNARGSLDLSHAQKTYLGIPIRLLGAGRPQ